MIENKILKWALILGIIVVLNLFFAYALKVIYNSPEWDEFCPKDQVVERIDTKEKCLEEGGQWDENIYRGKVYEPDVIMPEGYCDLYFDCNNAYDEAREDYEKKVFITLVILGVISILIGFFIASIETVAMALSLGGVLTFIVASTRYWQYAGEYLQVGILGLALLVLIYLGIKKFK